MADRRKSSTIANPKFELYRNSIGKTFVTDGGSGATYRLDRIRAFADLSTVLEFAKRTRSSMASDETLYIYDLNQRKSTYYITSESIFQIGEGIPSTRRQQN